MEKKIRTEILKMTGIMVVLAGLGIYAHEFVIAGIEAKVALNLSIFALFGMAAAIAFRHVFALKNEVVALKALQVDYGQRARRPTDPYARPAIVFHEPELLGQGYRLITEELGKQDTLQISNATVQTLLHDVDQRINDRKSSILYFSGLMVFLGLLGAFMGLMKTVHSVSDLIGAMDVSGKGGSDSFGKMIEGMKAPLNGMSVGFSSSLFGLMTSMVLGALERCMTSAMKSLRNEFEHWLSHLAALESAGSEASARGSHEFAALRKVLEAGTAQIAELRRAVGDAAEQSAQARREVDRLAGAVAELADPRTFLQPVAAALHHLAQGQAAQLEDAAGERRRIGEAIGAVQELIGRTQLLDGDVLHRQLGQLIAANDRIAERAPVKVIKVTRGGGWLGTWLARRSMLQEARTMRAEARASLAEIGRLVAREPAGRAEGVPQGVSGALEMLRLRLGLAVESGEAEAAPEGLRKRGQA